MLLKKLFFILLLTIANLSLATGVDGGGGVGVKCPNKEIELLDIHEGKLKGLTYNENFSSLNEASDSMAKLLGYHIWRPDSSPPAEFSSAIKRLIFVPLLSEKEIIQLGEKTLKVKFVTSELPFSDDLGSYRIKGHCRLVQLALWDDEKATLTISRKYWGELSYFNKSALVLHEFSYVTDREESLENILHNTETKVSERTRDFVSRLLSEQKITPTFSPFFDYETRYEMDAYDSRTFAYLKEENGNTFVYFNELKGYVSFYSVSIKLDQLTIKDLQRQEKIIVKSPLYIDEQKTDFLVIMDIENGVANISVFDSKKQSRKELLTDSNILIEEIIF